MYRVEIKSEGRKRKHMYLGKEKSWEVKRDTFIIYGNLWLIMCEFYALTEDAVIYSWYQINDVSRQTVWTCAYLHM